MFACIAPSAAIDLLSKGLLSFSVNSGKVAPRLESSKSLFLGFSSFLGGSHASSVAPICVRDDSIFS